MATSDFTGTQHSGYGNTGHDPITGSLTRRLGAPGKYYNAVAVTNITQSFNSESANYGFGAFMLGDGANIGGTSIDVVGGGTILGTDLLEHQIYDFAPSLVKAKTKTVYVFKVRNTGY